MSAWVLAAAVAAAALAGCGSGSSGAAEREELVVFGAASLSEVLEELEELHEADEPGVDVVLSLGASSTLAQQIVNGAPADVFAAASLPTMATVVEAGEAAGEPVVFARNRVVVAVPRGNPGGVRGLRDLARPELAVALCAPQVPCGSAAQEALTAARVAAAPDTLEQDVKAVLAKVRLGEVDAGVVYVTDVRAAAPAVEAVEVTPTATTDYPVAVLADAPGPTARAFVELLTSPRGQEVLARAGFLPPP